MADVTAPFPGEPYRPGDLPGVNGVDPVPRDWMELYLTPGAHRAHGTDRIGYMRPSACETCARAYALLQQTYPQLPDADGVCPACGSGVEVTGGRWPDEPGGAEYTQTVCIDRCGWVEGP